MSRSRRAAERRAHWAERAAALWLTMKGYRVIARRCRTPVGEIDLIARRRDRLAFVEVKHRRSLDDAAWALTPRQQARIARAAEYWLAGHPEFANNDIGFDVILTAPWSRLRHLSDAFRV